jgi:2-polyprenyl-3-methyl-5-hydroxy-6-metoxy-1,4-benzoquinol methylase
MRAERVHRITALVKDKDVLDVGCVDHHVSKERSSYWLHRHIREHAASVLGLDHDRASVEALSAKGYEIVVGNAEDFTLNRLFDLVIAAELIEHLNNPALFLACARRHLKERGQLVLTTPNPFYPKRQFEILIAGRAEVHGEHTMWFCPQTLRVMLSNAGFRDIEITPLNNNDAFFGVGKLPSLVRDWFSSNLFATARR